MWLGCEASLKGKEIAEVWVLLKIRWLPILLVINLCVYSFNESSIVSGHMFYTPFLISNRMLLKVDFLEWFEHISAQENYGCILLKSWISIHVYIEEIFSDEYVFILKKECSLMFLFLAIIWWFIVRILRVCSFESKILNDNFLKCKFKMKYLCMCLTLMVTKGHGPS